MFRGRFRVFSLPRVLVQRKNGAARAAWMHIELDGPLAQLSGPHRFRSRGPSVQLVREGVERCAKDDAIAGVLLEIRRLSGGPATLSGLREALQRVHTVPKPLVVYMPYGGNIWDLFVASAGSQLLLGPETLISGLGLRRAFPYVRELLSRLGVSFDVYARGASKTVAEPLVATNMSEAHREQYESALGDIWRSLLEQIAEGRKVPLAAVEGWIERGLWSAEAAVGAGIADGIVHPDDLRSYLGSHPELHLSKYLRRGALVSLVRRHRAHIAVIELKGPLVVHTGRFPRLIDADQILASIANAEANPHVRGVVLYVQSGGGATLTGHWALQALLRLRGQKPVVAFLGDTALSAAFMIASGAHEIVAHPWSLAGAMGVVVTRPSVESLLSQLGVAIPSVSYGSHARLAWPVQSATDAERKMIEAHVDDMYERFLAAIASARGVSADVLRPHADGRIFTGREALARGLVDRVGGFEDAVDSVRRRIGADGAELAVRVLPTPKPRRRARLLPQLV